MLSNQPHDEIAINEDRSFRAYHSFVRHLGLHSHGPLTEDTWRAYNRAIDAAGVTPATDKETYPFLDALPEYQLWSWFHRMDRQRKYNTPDYGVVAAVRAQEKELAPKLDAIAAEGIRNGRLKLNPDLKMPAYFTQVDFHQHPEGVWQHPLDGLSYDLARRTTNPAHSDPNDVYRMIFSHLPDGAKTDRVLDWGTGHGAGVLTWLESHPNSEVHGVDIAAPCVKFAYAMAKDRGGNAFWSQQDLEHLDYPDNHFDVAFFCFMLHEIPPGPTKALFKEVLRVLKPGGVFLGMEIGRTANPFQAALQDQNCWLNNEPFMIACADADYPALMKKAGFSTAELGEYAFRHPPKGTLGPKEDDKAAVPKTRHNIYVARK